MRKIRFLILAMSSFMILTACGEVEHNSEEYDKDYEVNVENTHADNNENEITVPRVVISEELRNWVEPEDNGVVALTYYEVMKEMVAPAKVHDEKNCIDVASIEDSLAYEAAGLLGEYRTKYTASAIYERAIEVNAEYLDVMEMDDMGDGTYRFVIDFGTDVATIYVCDTEAFLD